MLKLCTQEEFASVAASRSNRQLVIRPARPGKLAVLLRSDTYEFGLADDVHSGSLREFDRLVDCISAAVKISRLENIQFEEIDLGDEFYL